MVVGDRQVMTIEHFSPLKKSLQRLGSWVVRQASQTTVPDTTSGFRAYNREAALQLQVVSKFTYTLETIIQAGKMTVAIDHVPIRTNPKTRESRLFPSMWSVRAPQQVSIFRIYSMYEPLRVFMTLAAILGVVAAGVWVRFLVSWFQGEGAGHVQSLILGAVLFNAAVVLAALGIIGDLLERPADHAAAHLRARAPARAAQRDPAVALRAGRQPERPAGRRPAPTRPAKVTPKNAKR